MGSRQRRPFQCCVFWFQIRYVCVFWDVDGEKERERDLYIHTYDGYGAQMDQVMCFILYTQHHFDDDMDVLMHLVFFMLRQTQTPMMHLSGQKRGKIKWWSYPQQLVQNVSANFVLVCLARLRS